MVRDGGSEVRRCRGMMRERKRSSSVMGPYVRDGISLAGGWGLRAILQRRNCASHTRCLGNHRVVFHESIFANRFRQMFFQRGAQ